MLLFIPRSLCALKRVAAKVEHAKFGATQSIRITLASGVYRAEATDGWRALVVQDLVPGEDPPWPGFKEPARRRLRGRHPAQDTREPMTGPLMHNAFAPLQC